MFPPFLRSFQVRTLFVSGLPMDAKPRELYLLFRAYEGYEGSLLKVTSKNGKTASVSTRRFHPRGHPPPWLPQADTKRPSTSTRTLSDTVAGRRRLELRIMGLKVMEKSIEYFLFAASGLCHVQHTFRRRGSQTGSAGNLIPIALSFFCSLS